MIDFFFWTVFLVFAVATVALACYGLHLYVLLFLFVRQARAQRRRQDELAGEYAALGEDALPHVTSQIPIYNEADVAVRVIDAVAAFDYPRDRHEIQILDDSTDGTRAMIDEAAKRHADAGLDVTVLRRQERTGFKAGALAAGLDVAKGRHIAIFDADFVPRPDFLRRAIPNLERDERLACIQGRWAHLNQNESWLTRAQALGIDGHFAVEQGARAWNGLMMNFNGTAGVWRAEAIRDPDVGGWSGDTLTEDLDLSYRAQLAGWRLDYNVDLACPAELPNNVTAFKSQQRRWATGSIQVARKLLPSIWRARLSIAEKLEATMHLTHYSAALWMVLLALAARPMLLVIADKRLYTEWAWIAWSVILVSAFAPSIVYTYARYSLGGKWSGLRTIPAMFVLGSGMCLSNGLAVLRGLRLRGGEFVRTPKSGSVGTTGRPSSYQAIEGGLWIGELVLGAYAAATFAYCFTSYHRAFSIFLLIYAVGFTVIGWHSRPRKQAARSGEFPLVTAEATS